MSKKKFTGSFSGKGYYIALVLCAAAIGISGFLYYRNTNQTDDAKQVDGMAAVNEDQNAQQPVSTGKPDSSADNQTGEVPNTETPKVRKTVYPVEGQTVSAYAMDHLSYNQTTRDWRVHNGIDIAAEAGTQVCAAADGQVYTVYDDESMGMTVVIRHSDGYTTKYASLEETVAVEPGDTVTAGQVIGTVGNTALMETAIGDHIHFSVSCNGEIVDPNGFLNGQ